MDDELWQAIAELASRGCEAGRGERGADAAEFPRAAVAARVAITKSRQEDPMLRMVRTFEDSMTLDTVRNEYLLHRRIHERFADGETRHDGRRHAQ